MGYKQKGFSKHATKSAYKRVDDRQTQSELRDMIMDERKKGTSREEIEQKMMEHPGFDRTTMYMETPSGDVVTGPAQQGGTGEYAYNPDKIVLDEKGNIEEGGAEELKYKTQPLYLTKDKDEKYKPSNLDRAGFGDDKFKKSDYFGTGADMDIVEDFNKREGTVGHEGGADFEDVRRAEWVGDQEKEGRI